MSKLRKKIRAENVVKREKEAERTRETERAVLGSYPDPKHVSQSKPKTSSSFTILCMFFIEEESY